MPDQNLDGLLRSYFAHASEPDPRPGLEERLRGRLGHRPGRAVRLVHAFVTVFLALAIAGFGVVLAQALLAGNPRLASPRHADLSVPCPPAAPPVSQPLPTPKHPGDYSLPPSAPFAVPGWAAAAAAQSHVDYGTVLPHLQIDPGDPCFLVVSGVPSFVSADGGRSWGGISDPVEVSLATERGRRVLVGRSRHGDSLHLVVSRDDGRTWSDPGGELARLLGGYDAGGGVWLGFQDEHTLLRGLLPGDGFRSYSLPDGFFGKDAFEWSHGGHETVMVTGNDTVVARKEDGGAFSLIRLPASIPRETGIALPQSAQEVGQIIAWPGSDVVLASRVFGGLWRSADAGVTWRQVEGSLLVPGTYTINPEISTKAAPPALVSPTVIGLSLYRIAGRLTLLAATGNGPIQSTDEGLTWQWLPGFPVSQTAPSIGAGHPYAVVPEPGGVYALADQFDVELVRGDSGRVVPPVGPQVDPRPLGGSIDWRPVALAVVVLVFLFSLFPFAIIDRLRPLARAALSSRRSGEYLN